MIKQCWIALIACILGLVLSFAAPAIAAETTANQLLETNTATPKATAIFAGGCFWCMEKPFDDLAGVLDTTSGYIGGTVENPSYGQVSNGNTGHFEAVKVTYNSAEVSYDELLDVFWHNVDPVDNRGQFCDKGSQYRSAIFYQNEQQEARAQDSTVALANSGKLNQAIATTIQPASAFYPAEDYHQNYYQTHPVRYKLYRLACGRDQRLEEVWGAAVAH
ncbi:MAG: peptide-methionine (S)-S-oxide reductase MsrA [Cyanobacteria bacterium P01_D01_bin.71]